MKYSSGLPRSSPVAAFSRCLVLGIGVALAGSALAAGLRVDQVEPVGPSGAPFERLRIEFTSPVQESSLEPADIQLVGPGEVLVPVASLTRVTGSVYEVAFETDAGANRYVVTVGPEVLDLAGEAMDQDGDGLRGEAGEDAFRAWLVGTGTTLPAADASREGWNLVVAGATLATQGDHSFAHVFLGTGAEVTVAEPGISVGTLVLRGDARISLAGGGTLGVASRLDVGSGTTLLAESKNRTGMVEGQWVGRGVTIQAADAVVAAGGRISADGYGYEEQQGPGGVTNGSGTHGGRGRSNPAEPYGSAEQPVDLGSGGHNYTRGGGAIRLVVANTLTLDGQISADGSSWSGFSYGSAGGALWIETGQLAGAGSIHANGSSHGGQNGGGGRVAVHARDVAGFADLRRITASAGGEGAQHGTALLFDTSRPGRHLTVLQRHEIPGSTAVAYDDLLVEEGGVFDLGGGATLAVGSNLTIRSNAMLVAYGKDQAAPVEGQWVGRGVTITAGEVVIAEGGRMSADGQGYMERQGPGGASGGSGTHGGRGKSNPTTPYGSAERPLDLGSGGHNYTTGGGAIHLVVADALTVDGEISADGSSWSVFSYGSAGGSVWIETGRLAGAGSIHANGSSQGGQNGGGGRVAVHYRDASGFADLRRITASRGGPEAEHGTTLLFDTRPPGRQLRIFQRHALAADETATYTDLALMDGASFELAGGGSLMVTRSLTLETNSTLWIESKDSAAAINGEWQGRGATVAAQDLHVAEGARLTADGQGYGAQLGPGGSSSQPAVHGGRVSNNPAAPYGSPTLPVELGSGGTSHTAGGGAIRLIVTNLLHLDGTISADAATWWQLGGRSAGGSVWIDAGQLAGRGAITAHGNMLGGTSGSGGRVAVYYDDASQWTGLPQSGARSQADNAEHGTAYFVNRTTATTTFANGYVLPDDSELVFPNLTLANGATVQMGGGAQVLVAGTLRLTGNSTLILGGKNIFWLVDDAWRGSGSLIRAGELVVETGCRISVDGQGYLASDKGQPVRYLGSGPGGGYSPGGGGGYGGKGGGSVPGGTYGSDQYPTDLGSGGGGVHNDGRGGGALELVTGVLTLDGILSANGLQHPYGWDRGGGSGGSLFVSTGTLRGVGHFEAHGGDGAVWGGVFRNGGGGGGRIAVYHADATGFQGAAASTVAGGEGVNPQAQPGTLRFFDTPEFHVWTDNEVVHGEVMVRFRALGVDTRGATVAIDALGAGVVPLATGVDPGATFRWDTRSLPDGRYTLRARFQRGADVLGEAEGSLVILNDAEWHTGEIVADETWGAGRLQVVAGRLHVAAGVRVTVAPAAVVKVLDDAVVHLADGGILETQATPDQPGAFTSIHDDVAGGDSNFNGDETGPGAARWRLNVGSTGLALLSAATRVAGGLREQAGRTLAGNETWARGFVHHLTGSTVVPTNVTLRIEAGTVIKLRGADLQIQAGGKLESSGGLETPVVFTSQSDDTHGGDSNRDGRATTPKAGDWLGLNCLGGELALTATYLSYAGGNNESMIRAHAGAVVRLRDCVLSQTIQEAVSQRDGAGLVSLENCVVSGSTIGFHALSGTNTTLNCTFVDNATGAMGGGTAQFACTNTLFAFGSQYGVRMVGNPAATMRFCDVWGFTRGAYGGMSNPTGTEGNLATDPFLLRRSLGDFRLNPRSPLIDAGDGASAPPLDAHGMPRYDEPGRPNTGVPTPDQQYPEIGAFEFHRSLVADVDLAVGDIQAPATLSAGDFVTVGWTVTNLGTNAVTGPWYDTVRLVNDPGKWPTELPVAELPVLAAVTLGPGESRCIESAVRVPGGKPRDYVWQVTVNSHDDVYEAGRRTNNLAVSAAASALTLPTLAMDGTVHRGQFAGVDQPMWFRFLPTPDRDLELTLTMGSDSASVLVYVGAGYLPGPAAQDALGGEKPAAQTVLRISNSQNQEYYVLLDPKHLPSTPADFTLAVRELEFAVTRVSPATVGNTGKATLAIAGTSFPAALGVRLIRPDGATLVPERLDRLGSPEARATFDLTGQPAGLADLVLLEQVNELLRVTNAVAITDGGTAAYQLDIQGAETLRAGREYPVTVHWSNEGSLDGELLLVEIEAPDWVELRDKARGPKVDGRMLFFTPRPGASGTNLGAGERGERTVFVRPTRSTSFDLKVTAYPLDDPALPEHVIDWDGIGARVKPPGMDEAFWTRYWDILRSRLGGTSREMFQGLARHAVALAQPTEPGAPLPENRGIDLLQAMRREIGESVRLARHQGRLQGAARQDGGDAPTGGQVHTLLVGSGEYSTYNSGGVDLNEGAIDVDVWADYYSRVAQATDVDKFVDRATAFPVDMGLGPGAPGGPHQGEANLLSRLQQMADEAQPGDVIVFHYSGHSLQEGIQLPDRGGDGTHVVNWTKIYTALADTKASKIVVTLDSCYSGGAVQTWDRWEKGYEVLDNPTPATPVDPNKWIIVSATSEAEVAKTGIWGDGGLLTKEYINHLEANDGDVSFYEAFDDMGGEIRNLGRVQHPQWYGNDKDFSFKGADQFGEGKDDLPKNPGSFKPTTPKKGPVKKTTHSVVVPKDPNEKATVGVGTQGYIRGDQPIEYTIFFENDPKAGATAPVQELLITDQLPGQLDWATFELTSLSFGDHAITIPSGRSQFHNSTGLPGNPYPVLIDVELNPATGLASWLVRSWDDATQDLPLDALAGFLPVNDGTGRGQGSVTFRVRPKAGLANATAIQNRATITFDPTYGVNAPIRTPSVRNTIDALAPTSHVAALPAESMERITVAWSGADPKGSGVASYDVYAAVDRGPYELWLKETALTSAVFTGATNRVYSFFSRARDRVGHLESVKTSGEAQTTVTEPAPAYYAWAAQFFAAEELADPTLESGLWGLPADPEGDGKANLVEYFLGLHPRQAEAGPTLQIAVEGDQLRVTFRQARELANVEPVIEWSNDLANWSAESVAVETIGELPAVWLRRASIAVGGASEKYVRFQLRWTGQP